MKDIKAIEQEADEYADKVAFVVPYDGSNNFYNDEVYKEAKKHFIAGRSKSLERERQLEDKLGAAKLALKEIYTGTSFPLSIAQNALQVINNTTFMPNDLKADEEKEKRVRELEEALRELVNDMKERRKSFAKKKQESADSYQEQYCHGRIDEGDYVIVKLKRLQRSTNG